MINIGGIKAEVKFNVAQIRPETEFRLSLVFLTDLDENVKPVGYIEGLDMFMGKVPLIFNPSTDHANNTVIAKTQLGSCTEEKMIWRIWFALPPINQQLNGSLWLGGNIPETAKDFVDITVYQ